MRRTFLIAGGLVAFGTAPLFAQAPRPERPYRGLFGGGVGQTEQLLTVNFSVGGGYDGNILAPESAPGSTPPPPGATRSGTFGLASGSLTYSLNRTRVSFNASEATATQYYPQLRGRFVTTHSAVFGTSLQMSKKTSLTASETLTYQPYLTLPLFPQLFDPSLSEAVPPNQELGIKNQSYVTYATNAGLTEQLSQRASLTFAYGRRTNRFSSTDPSFSAQSAAGRFSYSIARGLALRVGYGYARGDYGSSTNSHAVANRTIDAGVDYNRALSFSRRTTLSFTSGSTGIQEQGRTYYRLVGSATLRREIGRTWDASLSYNRNVNFVETFGQPFFADSATLGVGGLLSRRLRSQSSLGASIGQVGVATNQNGGYRSYYGTTGVTWGISRNVGVSIDYTYYRYAFAAGAVLPAGLPTHTDRQSVRASLNLWEPLIHRARRPDASR